MKHPQGMLHTLPDFLIIGAQKAGTTSLYNYLTKHPQILPAKRKEVHFFDTQFEKGVFWYRSQFPSALQQYWHQLWNRKKNIAGEASPYYLFHPYAPARIANAIPNIKLIVLLRDPISRAYSHYRMNVKKELESLSFEKAIERELAELPGEIDRINNDENYSLNFHRNFSYLSRGIYVDQLQHWSRYFPPEQMMVIESNAFQTNTAKVFQDVLDYLELPADNYRYKDFKHYHVNKNPNSPISTETMQWLRQFYQPHNERLFDYLGTRWDWETDPSNEAAS